MENNPTTSSDNTSNEIKYPDVSDRVKAAVADACVMIAFMLLLSVIFSKFEHVPDYARIIGFIFIFGLYDPLFTNIFGGTIGHMIMKIQVKRIKSQEKNIVLPLAMIRFVVKTLLGWVSLISIGYHKQNLALHDMLVGSIVTYKNK